MGPVFELVDVSAGYLPGRAVIRGLTLTVQPGEFVAVIGPNGSGKTTLLRVMAGALRPWAGAVKFLGTDLSSWRRARLAQRLAVVPQLSPPAFDFTVRDFVALGRTPYLSPWSPLRPRDLRAVEQALITADLMQHAERPISHLSGGELQRVIIARALAQEPEVLLLDEPTAFLDPGHAVAVMALLRQLNAKGLTLVAVFHDLSIAAACSRIVALRDGELFRDGPPGEVLRADVLTDLYGTPASVLHGPNGEPVVYFQEALVDAARQ